MGLLLSFSYVGIVVNEEAKDIIGQGRELKELKPKKEDIVQE